MKEPDSRSSWRITWVYLILGGSWILFTDWLVGTLFDDPDLLSFFQTMKGWLFVLVSAILIHFLLRREFLQRDKAEQLRRESDQRYRVLVQQASDGIFILDESGRYLDVNASLSDMLGYAREEIIGSHVGDHIHDGEVIEAEDLDSLQAGKTVLREHQIRQRDGNLLTVEVSAKMLPGGRVQGILRNISERKGSEQALRTWAEIFQSTRTGVAVLQVENNQFSLVNNAFAEMHGYEVEELSGKPFQFVFAPHEHTHALEYVQLADQTVHQIFEVEHARKDGTLFPALMDITAVKDEAGDVLYRVMTVQDISERKQAELALQRQLQRMASLRSIDLAITATLDKRITFNILLDQVTTQLGVDAAAVLLFDPLSQRLKYAASRGFHTSAIRQTSLQVGDGLAGKVALRVQPLVCSNLLEEEDSLVRDYLISQERFITYYGLPLVAKGQLKGILEVFHRSPFTPEQDWIDFLEALAGQAAIAIDNASLYEELQRSTGELSQAYDATLMGWSRALELRDHETQGHAERVTALTMRLAREMGVEDTDLVHVQRGTLLHDIGKMAIPDKILLKPGPLTAEEWEVMRQHPLYAYEMLAPIGFLSPALDIPYAHHERWDGNGYPRGLQGEQIPLAARIFSVVDVWDALLSTRPYRRAWPTERVVRYLHHHSGTHFDPLVVRTFLDLVLEDSDQEDS